MLFEIQLYYHIWVLIEKGKYLYIEKCSAKHSLDA